MPLVAILDAFEFLPLSCPLYASGCNFGHISIFTPLLPLICLLLQFWPFLNFYSFPAPYMTLAIVKRQSSIIKRQSSIIKRQLSIVDRRLSIVKSFYAPFEADIVIAMSEMLQCKPLSKMTGKPLLEEQL